MTNKRLSEMIDERYGLLIGDYSHLSKQSLCPIVPINSLVKNMTRIPEKV